MSFDFMAAGPSAMILEPKKTKPVPVSIVSSSVAFFSYCPQSFPASGSFPMSQFFASGGQSIGASASASVLSMNTRVDFL